jgi:hypothetical protein
VADPFAPEKVDGEIGVGAADIGEAPAHARPAEKVRFEPLAPRAEAKKAVDEELHRVAP